MEAQLKNALTITTRAKANREKRKADNLDDSASPPEKLQRFTVAPGTGTQTSVVPIPIANPSSSQRPDVLTWVAKVDKLLKDETNSLRGCPGLLVGCPPVYPGHQLSSTRLFLQTSSDESIAQMSSELSRSLQQLLIQSQHRCKIPAVQPEGAMFSIASWSN